MPAATVSDSDSDLSEIADRPAAIRGAERRIEEHVVSVGAFGMDLHLPRDARRQHAQEHRKRQEGIDDRVLSGRSVRVFVQMHRRDFGRMGIARHAGFAFAHRSEIPPGPRHRADEHQQQQRIKPERNCREEHAVSIGFEAQLFERGPDLPEFKTDPGRDHSQTRDGGRCRVHQKRQLLTRDAEPIRDRAHRAAHEQRVGVIIEEHHQPQQPRHHLAVLAGPGKSGQAVDQGPRAAAGGHDPDHSAEHQREHHGPHMVGAAVGRSELVEQIGVDHPQEGQKRIAPREHHRSREHARQQGHDHILKPHRENDCDQRRQQAEPFPDQPHVPPDCLAACGDAEFRLLDIHAAGGA